MKKIYSISEWPALLERCAKWKEDGDSIVFSNGCFDGLHPGHQALLAFAKEQGDRFIVALNNDEGVRRLKGSGRPLFSEQERAESILRHIEADAIVFFEDPTPEKIIRLIKPDCLIKGGDYRPDTVVGADDVRSYGGRVLIFPRIPGYSSTKLHAKKEKNIETKKE